MLMLEAILCKKCAKKRAKINFLRKENYWIEVDSGEKLLNELENEKSNSTC